MAQSARPIDQWDSGGTRLQVGHPADPLVMLLLALGFFLGPLKLLGTSWLGYLSADGLALLVLFVIFAERVASQKPLFAASPLSVPLLLLAAGCLLELANPDAPLMRSALGLRSWLLYLGFYFVGLYTLRSIQQLERLYSLLLALGVVTAVYGVYQWRAGPQSFAGWSEYYGQNARLIWMAQSGAVFRAFSTFVTPGAFGGNMALLMLLAFSVAISSRIRSRWRVFAAAAFGAMGAGIATSGSRGAVAHLLVAGAIGLAFVPGVRQRVRAGFMAVVMAGVAVGVVAFLMGPVISERFSSMADPGAFFWKWFLPFTNGVRIAQEHPFGMGLGYTAGVPRFIANPVFAELPTTNVDSGYGSAVAELGFLGLALFIYLAVKVGIEGFRTWNHLPPSRTRDLLLGPALYAAAYPIVSVIFQPQATLPSAIYFWLLIGMLMKAPALQRALDADQLLSPKLHPGQ